MPSDAVCSIASQQKHIVTLFSENDVIMRSCPTAENGEVSISDKQAHKFETCLAIEFSLKTVWHTKLVLCKTLSRRKGSLVQKVILYTYFQEKNIAT